MRDCYIQYLIPSFLLQRICLDIEYTGRFARIPDKSLLDCVHDVAYPKRAHDGTSVEESLRSAGRSVAAATDAADVHRFVGPLQMLCASLLPKRERRNFHDRGGGGCKRVVEACPGLIVYSYFLDEMPPDIYGHANISRLIINDALYARPKDILLMV